MTETVSRKVNREAVVLLGWGRAILLQVAHPLVAAGVADYSPFGQSRRGYLRRARRTVDSMLKITFGTDEEARAVIDGINAIHARVKGTLRESAGPFPAGTPYSAEDPELLCWVHATLLDSSILAYERFVGPLTREDKDRYCAEAGATAQLFGIPERLVPAGVDELDRYMQSMYASGRIEVTETARALARALLSPPLGPAVPMFRVARLITIGLLPPDIRQAYGFAWEQRHQRTFDQVVVLLRQFRALLPQAFREWPAARMAA